MIVCCTLRCLGRMGRAFKSPRPTNQNNSPSLFLGKGLRESYTYFWGDVQVHGISVRHTRADSGVRVFQLAQHHEPARYTGETIIEGEHRWRGFNYLWLAGIMTAPAPFRRAESR